MVRIVDLVLYGVPQQGYGGCRAGFDHFAALFMSHLQLKDVRAAIDVLQNCGASSSELLIVLPIHLQCQRLVRVYARFYLNGQSQCSRVVANGSVIFGL